MRPIYSEMFYCNFIVWFVFRLGSDPERIFPRDLMMEHLRKYGKLGLIYATVVLPIIISEKEKKLNIDELASQYKEGKAFSFDAILSEKSKIKRHQRLRDVVIDMVRLGYV